MDQHMYHVFKEVEDSHWWFVGRRRVIKQVLSSLNLPKLPRILDVGCGTGGNLPVLAEFGHVIGMEMDDGAIEMARMRQVGRIEKGGLPDDLPRSTETFDVILLLDVLEHIDDERASLKALKALLTPAGYMVLTVPAFPYLWSKHDEDNHHKRRYLASTFEKALEDAELKIEHLTYFNMWLFPLAAIVRIMKKVLSIKETGSELQIPRPPVNTMFQAIFGSERHLVTWARMPFGLSLLAIVRSA